MDWGQVLALIAAILSVGGLLIWFISKLDSDIKAQVNRLDSDIKAIVAKQEVNSAQINSRLDALYHTIIDLIRAGQAPSGTKPV